MEMVKGALLLLCITFLAGCSGGAPEVPPRFAGIVTRVDVRERSGNFLFPGFDVYDYHLDNGRIIYGRRESASPCDSVFYEDSIVGFIYVVRPALND